MTVQTSLFDTEHLVVSSRLANSQMSILQGLLYIPDYITRDEEDDLLEKIDTGIWLHDLKRRVQHFGYKYDYRARNIDAGMRLDSLPKWLLKLAVKLHLDGHFKEVPDQVIVNEYEPGQGISPHIDCEPCFADTVVSLSLHSTAVMEFSKEAEKISLLLEPRSAVVLAGKARYDWKHCIPSRKKDLFQGHVFPRKRRISLTFRKVIL